MGAGGIINQKARALLVAAQDQSMYDSLSTADQAKVDAIGNKNPTSLDVHDCDTLLKILHTAVKSPTQS